MLAVQQAALVVQAAAVQVAVVAAETVVPEQRAAQVAQVVLAPSIL